MNDYLIYTDASADIAPSVIEKYDIRFVAMNYTVEEEERLCTNLEEPSFLKNSMMLNGREKRHIQVR